MPLNNKLISKERNITGFLKSRSEWSESVAYQLAEKENIVLTDEHWDIIQFVRAEFYTNTGLVPHERYIMRAMEAVWDTPVSVSEQLKIYWKLKAMQFGLSAQIKPSLMRWLFFQRKTWVR